MNRFFISAVWLAIFSIFISTKAIANGTLPQYDVATYPTPVGSTDLTSRISSLLSNQCITDGGCRLLIPAGQWDISASITVPDVPVVIEGLGRGVTSLRVAHATADMFNVTSSHPFEMRNITMTRGTLPARTSGAFVKIDPGVGKDEHYSIFHNVLMNGGPTLIHFVRASYFLVEGSVFGGCAHACIKIENHDNDDRGDSTIIANNFFLAEEGSGAAILQHSSGGLKVTANKFLGGEYGYWLNLSLANQPATSIAWINGNSFENQKLSGVKLEGSGPGAFRLVHVADNEFFSQPISIDVAGADQAGTWLSDASFDNNTIVPDWNGVAIRWTGGANLHSRLNDISGVGPGAPTTAYQIAAGVTGDVGLNSYSNVALIYNDASAGGVTHLKRTMSGVATATMGSSITYGGFYNGDTTINFVTPLPSLPTMSYSIKDGAVGGGVTVIGLGTLTTSAAPIRVLGAAPSTTVDIQWTASYD